MSIPAPSVHFSEIENRNAAISLCEQVKKAKIDPRRAFAAATSQQKLILVRLLCPLVDPIRGKSNHNSTEAWKRLSENISDTALTDEFKKAEQDAGFFNDVFQSIDKIRNVEFPISFESLMARWDELMVESKVFFKKLIRGHKAKPPSSPLAAVIGNIIPQNPTEAMQLTKNIARAEEGFSDIAKFVYHANGKSYQGRNCTNADLEKLLLCYSDWEVINKIFKEWLMGDVVVINNKIKYTNPLFPFAAHISHEREMQNNTNLSRRCLQLENIQPYPINLTGTKYAAKNDRELYSILDAGDKFISPNLGLRIGGHSIGDWLMLFFDFRDQLLSIHADRSSKSTGCQRISLREISGKLSHSGHNAQLVDKFLDLIVFDPRASRDLFDGLLINDTDSVDKLLYSHSFVDNVNFSPTLISIFNKESVDTSERGFLFEDLVKKNLATCGIKAQRVHKKDNILGEFELDLSFEIDGRYYFIQCKSCSPIYAMSSEKLVSHLVDFHTQARRVSDYFRGLIGVIPELTGTPGASYHRTIIVVSCQMPFSVTFPKGDIILVDWSTLQRFLARDCPGVILGDMAYRDRNIEKFFIGPLTSMAMDEYLDLHYVISDSWQNAVIQKQRRSFSNDIAVDALAIATYGGMPFGLDDVSEGYFKNKLLSMGYSEAESTAAIQGARKRH